MSNPRLEPTALTMARKAAGMNRTKLAEACGLSARTIERWEQKRSRIEDADILNVLAVRNALGCDIEKIFDDVPEVTPAQKKEKNNLTKQIYDTKLETARRALGLNRKEFSELSGVEYRAITAYEYKLVPISNGSAEIVYRLAKTLGVRIEDILE